MNRAGGGMGKQLSVKRVDLGQVVEVREGMTFSIEPMVNLGSARTETLDDGWTVVTRDGKLSAQFEHTVAVTSDGVEVLTLRQDERV